MRIRTLAEPVAHRRATSAVTRLRSNSLGLGAYPGAVPSARLHSRLVLAEWGLAELSDDTGSVVTELVENAVQATARAGLDAPVRLTLLGGLRTVLVVVWDAVADPPVPRRPVNGALASRAAPALPAAVPPDTLPDPLAAWTDDGTLAAWADDDEDDPDTHGRGLVIVAALSATWDWKPCPGGGKVVRALLRGQR